MPCNTNLFSGSLGKSTYSKVCYNFVAIFSKIAPKLILWTWKRFPSCSTLLGVPVNFSARFDWFISVKDCESKLAWIYKNMKEIACSNLSWKFMKVLWLFCLHIFCFCYLIVTTLTDEVISDGFSLNFIMYER